MSSRRTHIEPSVCGRILALFKCIVLYYSEYNGSLG